MDVRHKTWNIIYKVSSFNDRFKARYAELSEREKIIQQLYNTQSQEDRRSLYLQACAGDEETYQAAREFFNKVFYYCFRKGFKKIAQWVSHEENDPIDWALLFESERFKNVIQQYAERHAATRKQQLQLEKYETWDYWYNSTDANSNCLYTKQVVPDFARSLSVIDQFYKNLGFDEIFSQIEFIRKEGSPTYALIHEKNGIWLNEIYLSESGAGSRTGSLNYLSVVAHETGHIIQSRHIKNPSKHFFLPPNPVNEIVSMFFERLFLEPAFLSQFTAINQNGGEIYREIQTEREEQLLRTLNVLEFEERIYALVEKNKLTANKMAEINRELKFKYYGFEPNDLDDHTWQRWIFYLSYSPFKQRSYVLGSLLSQIMLDNFLNTFNGSGPTQESLSYLHNMINTCSENGSFSTWQEYERACKLNEPLNTDFIIRGIEKSLLGNKIVPGK